MATLQGTASAELLTGLGGADTLTGLGGADTLRGGAGVDDLIYTGSTTVGVSVNLATGAVSGGHAQGDTLTDTDTASGFQTDFEAVPGSVHNDSLVGSAGANTLEGGAGDDSCDPRY